MLEMRKVLNKKLNKKGFTLAELLVVVAIIAILVAVSIPIFTGKLDEAKASTDKANMRAAKAAAISYYLGNENTADTDKFYNAENGTMVNTAADAGKGGAGYNQSETESGKAPKTAVIKVEINDTTNKDKPTVTATWVSL